MSERDLKKLNRKQLLELLLKQTERADLLEDKLRETEAKLLDKTIMEAEAGSIAEAALKLNGVFEAADAAVAQYLKNIKQLSKNQNLLIERMESKSKQKMAFVLLTFIYFSGKYRCITKNSPKLCIQNRNKRIFICNIFMLYNI